MEKVITLNEAATYLCVSKSTLRNWDREGKLVAKRHPINNYRLYDLDEINALKREMADDTNEAQEKISYALEVDDSKKIKKIISRLHGILRDEEGNSNIIERFDELTKLVFLKLYYEKETENIFKKTADETDKAFCNRIRNAYANVATELENLFPNEFSGLKSCDNVIIKCAEILCDNNFANTDIDIKGLLYEEVIKGTFDKNDNQQFFTPSEITSFMVDMMMPFIKGNICDPACGTGGFLIETLKSGCNIDKVYGFEIDKRLQWITSINVLLHGDSNCEIRSCSEGGTLGWLGDEYNESMDVILTNPPFGSDVTDTEILNKYVLGRDKSSRRRGVLFVEKCCELLKNDGYLGIVIDEGVLNASSNSDVRELIIRKFDILAVISLPESAFQPYASVNTSILLLKKKGENSCSQKTFFAKADKIGRKSNGDEDYIYDTEGHKLINSDLLDITDKWYRFNEGEEITNSEKLYITNVFECMSEEQSNRLDFQFHHFAREKYKKMLDLKANRCVSLAELCDERNESMVPSTSADDTFIQYTGLANISPYNGKVEQVLTPAESIKSAVKRYELGDIVFARMRPNLRKVALIPFENGGYVSPECSVFTVKKDKQGHDLVDREYLAVVMRSDIVFSQLLYKVTGVGRPRLSPADLRKVKIPIVDESQQKNFVSLYKGNMKMASQLEEQANQMLKKAKHIETSLPTKLIEEVMNYAFG